MNRHVVEVKFSELENMFGKLALSVASSPPITNALEVEDVLLRFGKCTRDSHMKRDVIRFDSLDKCNAARVAVSGNRNDLLPPECASAEEIIAFISEAMLFWLALGVVMDGTRRHYVTLMHGGDMAGLSKEAA